MATDGSLVGMLPGPTSGHTARYFHGTLGTSTPIELTVVRERTYLYGSYRYPGAGDPSSIPLAGSLDDAGTLTLREGKAAIFTLRADGHGGVVGTWADTKGLKSYPVALTPWGVPASPRSVYLEFLDRYARFRTRPPVPPALLATIRGDDELSLPEEEGAFAAFVPYDIPDLASLYVADVNNDGVPDYVLVWTNRVSNHNDVIWGVYDPVLDDGHPSLRQLDFAEPEALGGISTYRNEPFIVVTERGTVMRLMTSVIFDEAGDVVNPMVHPPDHRVDEQYVFMWNQSGISQIEHTKHIVRMTPGPRPNEVLPSPSGVPSPSSPIRRYTCKETPTRVRGGCACGSTIVDLCECPTGWCSPTYTITGNVCAFDCR